MMNRNLAGVLMLATALTPMAGHTQGSNPPVDLSFGVTAPPNGLPRTLSARAGDVFNPLDYGALGDGSGQMINSTYGANPTLASLALYTASNGSKPFAGITNPLWGWTFSLPVSAAQGGAGQSLTFVSTLTGFILGSSTPQIPTWLMPVNYMDYMQTGLLVTGPAAGSGQTGAGCIAADTTVSAIPYTTIALSAQPTGVTGTTPVNSVNLPTGVVTLSQNTASACPAGTIITFTRSSAQIQNTTLDALGIQAAVMAAYAGLSGDVDIPKGIYAKNIPIVVPIGTGASPSKQVILRGHGEFVTQINDIADLGYFSCSIVDGNRQPGSPGGFEITNLHLTGPGGYNGPGVSTVNMDGACLGEKSFTYRFRVSGYRSGINGREDHGDYLESSLDNNFYGFYLDPFSDVIGNWTFTHTTAGGEGWAGFGAPSTYGFDYSKFDYVSVGGEPYGFYQELPLPGFPTTGALLSNAELDFLLTEVLGNGVAYSELGSILNTKFVSGGFDLSGLVSNPSRAIPGRGGYKAALYANGNITGLSFEHTDIDLTTYLAAPTDAFFESANGAVANITIDEVYGLLSETVPISKAGYATFGIKWFQRGLTSGEYRRAGSNLTAGSLVAYGQGGFDSVAQDAQPMAADKVLLGVAVANATAGNMTPIQIAGPVQVNKTTDVAVPQSSLACASATTPTQVTACSSGNANTKAIVGAQQNGAGGQAASAQVFIDVRPMQLP